MFKKIVFISICLFMLIITGCSKKDNNSKKENKYNENAIIIYFSVTNNTRRIASLISKITNYNIAEIIPTERYTDSDIDYNNRLSRANVEAKDESIRPEIASEFFLDNYDTIYLGYPIWFETAPRIIMTFLDTYNLDGKRIILFCTSGSSDISKSVSDIQEYNNNLDIVASKRFDSDASNKEIEKWLNITRKAKSKNT